MDKTKSGSLVSPPQLDKLCSICQRVLSACSRNYAEMMGRPRSWQNPSGFGFGARRSMVTDCSTDIQDWLASVSHPHHRSLGDLKGSAAKGCHLCSLLGLHLPAINEKNKNLAMYVKHQMPKRGMQDCAWKARLGEDGIEM